MNTDNDNGNDNGNADVTTPATTPATRATRAPRATTRTRAPRAPRVRPVAIANVKTFADVLNVAATITPDNFGATLSAINATANVAHVARNVGRFTGGRVMDVQNAMMRDNRTLDDLQILFVWCADYPMASGRLYGANREPGSVAAIVAGIGIVRGVRAEYNNPNGTNPHHGAKFPVTTPSVMYGPKKFTFAVATARIPAAV